MAASPEDKPIVESGKGDGPLGIDLSNGGRLYAGIGFLSLAFTKYAAGPIAAYLTRCAAEKYGMGFFQREHLSRTAYDAAQNPAAQAVVAAGITAGLVKPLSWMFSSRKGTGRQSLDSKEYKQVVTSDGFVIIEETPQSETIEGRLLLTDGSGIDKIRPN